MTLVDSGTGGITELLITLVAVALALLMTLYIYRDADSRGSSHELAWGLGAFSGGPVVWILYYVVRDEVGRSGSM
ncbi:hypothetical protein [Natrinema sp. H-ect4]|uniref:hypothetical protein n=1 Tax=Natrinema sp. H-ect4 TaxID=3242699 RepID=UPI0035A93C3E